VAENSKRDPDGRVPFGEKTASSYVFIFSISSRIVSIFVLVGGAKARWIWSIE
jgi:hypothetical protein